jgi:hypothetical protein
VPGPFGHPLADPLPILAETLTGTGYVTGATSSNCGYLSPVCNLSHGVAAIRSPHKWIGGSAAMRELYDSAGDPQDSRNLYNSRHPTVEILDAELTR